MAFKARGFGNYASPCRSRLRGLGGKVGSACEEFEDDEGAILG